MRRLRDHQPVEIELDGEPDVIECHVLTVRGPAAALHYAPEISAHVAARLERGSLCFLVFSDDGQTVALRGVTRSVADLPALEFVVIDGVQVEERRKDPRQALIAKILLTPLGDERDGADAISTLTVDLSLGGALLSRRDGLRTGRQWGVELHPPGEQSPIRCRARIAHGNATHVGVEFLDMSDADRIRLAGALADHQRRLRRAA